MLDYISDRYRDFRGDVLAIPGRVIALVFFIILLVLPLFIHETFYYRFLILASIYAIFAVSWDLVSGFLGQVNLGHALFFGVAAYTDGLLNINFHFPPGLSILCGALAAVLAGFIIGIPALRLRGVYFALVTLAFPLIVIGIVLAFHSVTGGEMGLGGVQPLTESRTADYYITLLVMTVSVLVMWKLTDASSGIVRTGILFHAIREDEVTARISGINTTKYKLLAFAISGFFAGIAGGLYTHTIRIVSPLTLDLSLSLNAFIWTIFGGVGTIYGPVAGVYILTPLMEFFTMNQDLVKFKPLVLSLVLIIVILFMPQGFAHRVRDMIEKECPRCKLTNAAFRRKCRACSAELG